MSTLTVGKVTDRVADDERAALAQRSGSSPKGRTPNMRDFTAKLSIVAIYTLFKKAFKVILLSESFQRKSACFHTIFVAKEDFKYYFTDFFSGKEGVTDLGCTPLPPFTAISRNFS